MSGADHKLDQFFQGLEKGIPLEYLSEESYFYNFPLRVDRRVLIPRKETELLVEGALATLHRLAKTSLAAINILDVGTGSGAIALALALNYEGKTPVTITAVDISPLALVLAEQNARRLRYALSPHCCLKWYRGDCLQWDWKVEAEYHLIVSNPPYIKECDKRSVHSQVLRFEPSLALFLPDEEYEKWYETFFSKLKKNLVSDGEAWIEGSEDHLRTLQSIARKLDLRAEIKQDYTSRDRFLVLHRGDCG